MAANAGRVLMRALQRKLCGGVVETTKLLPIARVVAGFAGLFRRMRIVVAARATLIAEVILPHKRRRGTRRMSRIHIVDVCQRFVAIGAQNRCVSVNQNKFGLRVPRQIEGRGPEGFLCMTQLAAIFIRRCTKFPAMRIGMAIHADQLVGLVRSILSSGLMTLFAFQLEMLTLQLERTLLMHLAREERRLKLRLVMAGLTVRAGRAACELAVVNVFVAIAA